MKKQKAMLDMMRGILIYILLAAGTPFGRAVENPCQPEYMWTTLPSVDDIPAGQSYGPICLGDAINFWPYWGWLSIGGVCEDINDCGGGSESDTPSVDYIWTIKYYGNPVAAGTSASIYYVPTQSGTYTIELEKHAYANTAHCSWSEIKYGSINVDVVEVVELEWLEWTGELNDYTGEMHTGKQIFAGDNILNDPFERNKVIVRARIWPAVSGVNVHFKILDVDDVTDSAIIDVNGSDGGDNFGASGAFVANALNTISVATDAAGYAGAGMSVGMQPGDNYRVGASCDATEVNNLDEDNVEPDDTPVWGFAGEVSELLTVWRRLWVEFDQMVGPGVNGGEAQDPVIGQVFAYTTNGVPGVNNAAVMIIIDVFNYQESSHQFEGGAITVENFQTYEVVASYPAFQWSGFPPLAQIVINDMPGAGIIGEDYSMTDDDDLAILPATLSIDDIAVNAFEEAFILPKEAPLEYRDTNVPFHRNIQDVGEDWVFKDNHDVPNVSDYWSVCLLAAFQGGVAEDMDPDSQLTVDLFGVTGEPPLLGRTCLELFGAEGCNAGFIAMETMRDYENITQPTLSHTIVHEIGHMGGAGHRNIGSSEDYMIMEALPGTFLNYSGFMEKHLKRFREQVKY